MASSKLGSRCLLGVAGAAVALLGAPRTSVGSPPAGVDLSTYIRVGRFDLPEPTRTAAPTGNLLCQEASAVTYDWDTDSLFVVGDGGTAVVQVSKTGTLIDSMTLAAGGSPQGTEFYDTEGLGYVGGGKFVFVEERDRQVVLFTYAPGSTLTRAATKTVKLGTFVGNVGIEGVSFDPQTGGYVCVKETSPEGVFQTGIDFAAGTATNGSPTTVDSVDLFDPALAGLLDFADVFALSNLPSLAGTPDAGRLLILSQESGRIVNIDRNGAISSSLTIVSDPGNPLSIPGQQFEGVTMDRDGFLYVVGENAGGDFDHPQVWVYGPSSAVDQAPTALALAHVTTSIVENTATATRLKVADVVAIDDGIGTNVYSVSGPDAASFEVDGTGLYLKAGTVLDYETNSSYLVTVAVDDPGVGGSPDATVPYSLAVIDVVDETTSLPRILITEVAAWGSGNSPYAADWFELTNTGATAADLTGWKMDDNSNSFGLAVALNGVSTLAPGQSVVFVETTSSSASTVAATQNLFKNTWFGTNVPVGFTMGWYSGGGVGLSTGGDAVNVFDAAGTRVTGVQVGASPSAAPFRSFDNAAGLGSTTLPLTSISTLAAVGTAGAFTGAGDANEIGSPGRITNHAPVANAGPDQAVEATGPGGASASPTGAGSFDADGDFLTFTWSESGTPFAAVVASAVSLPLGTHTLTLLVTDPYGAAATDTVTVLVKDTTGPAISGTPDGITVEAASPAGTAVTFTAPTAVDLVDGPVAVHCLLDSGAVFPVGTTLDTCTATDAHGNSSTSSFRVTVRDTTAPVVTVPADVTVHATSPAGAVVTYVASATDAVGVATFVCVPASGSTFPIGTTAVTCTATDAAGNSATVSFHVHVAGAVEQLEDLLPQVRGVGPGRSLEGKVGEALARAQVGDASGAGSTLGAFIGEVNAQSGKKITRSLAVWLIDRANGIRAVLGH